jgi:two-component system sensor histidine kinase/response regulator
VCLAHRIACFESPVSVGRMYRVIERCRSAEPIDRALPAGETTFLTRPLRPTAPGIRVKSALRLRPTSAELREHDRVRQQRDDLVRLQLEKERLTAFVVHDLKNPVYAMDLHAQLLLRDPELPGHARDSVQSIRNEARSLLRLVLNLLDISQSEEGQLTPRPAPVDLVALAAEAVEAHHLAARMAEVVLERSIDALTVTADPDLLRRIVDNLLDNAIRHARARTAVRLIAARTDGAVVLRVSDSGPGIAPDMREKVFERFVRIESDVVRRTERGLGLAFCKLAVEAHGGRIWVEEGAPGAVFCVSFPDGG